MISRSKQACRAFCYSDGKPVSRRFESRRRQYKIERNMRLFYRMRYTHHRHMAVEDPATQNLSNALSRSNLAGADNGSGSTQLPPAMDAIGSQPTDEPDLEAGDGWYQNGGGMPSIAETAEARCDVLTALQCRSQNMRR